VEKYYLGVDIGSVSTNIVLIDKENTVIIKIYKNSRQAYYSFAKWSQGNKRGIRKF